MSSSPATSRLPTASPAWLGALCGVLCTAVLLTGSHLSTWSTGLTLSVAAIFFALPGITYELWRMHGRRSDRFRMRPLNAAMIQRAFQRTIGLAQILLCGWLALRMLPEYNKDMYQFFRDAYPVIYGSLLAASLPYFIVGEILGRGRPQRDIHRYIGQYTLITALYRVWTKPILRQGLLAYIVKLFFLPNMLGLAWYSVDYISQNSLMNIWGDETAMFHYLWRFVNLVDVIIAIVGYSLSLRLLNTHVVHTDPTWRGWVATCICYFPFSTVLYASYLTYGDGIEWNTALAGFPGWLYAYGAMLLVLHFLYMFSSLQFGIRFSNMSHKGILTDGLFRYTRHPAYLFKNIIWWLQSIPFIYEGAWWVGASNCAILFGVNVVYWWRARTEEMHLSRDPLYVEYALAMNEKSVVAFLGRWFPALQYRAPDRRQEYEYRIFNSYSVNDTFSKT